MPEEKKKENFTFSDKIKDSKQTASKSFAKRFSSKIGSDGKPRQTLFERTKRDAPFFIAALVALLLLPFLYKYSGQVNEDASMVTPGYEDAILNPDRSGFDFTGDAEGQISQLAGRDSMDLIVGFGKKKDEESDESLDELYRSGLSDEAAAAASSYSRDDMDEEINNTNIYKYRKNAPRQTRAAFRRAATKINRLGNAGLKGREGGVNIQPWGGGLKNAAQKVKADRPRTAPKPVSLQPLTATGKPSRSSFGQGAAAEARRSKDAMGKNNPLQALMDAQMRPVEPHKIGGIGSGNFGGPGGGNGSLQRQFAFNGKEPWWWDLMKTRSQMEWERHFNRKWKYIDALDDIILGLARCLITGNSDGDPDTFLGSGGGAGGKEPKCCGMKEKRWKAIHPEIGFNENACKGWMTSQFGEKYKEKCPSGWEAGHGGGEVRLGFFGTRWNCLGGLVLGAERGSFEDGANCEMFASQGIYEANFSSTKGKSWYIWHYVVGVEAKNLEKYYKASPSQQQDLLEILYVGEGPVYNLDSDPARNIKGIPLFVESLAIRAWKKGIDYKRIRFDLESGAGVGSTYREFVGNLRKRGVIIAGDGSDADPYSDMFIKRRGKEGKSWIIGGRCDYPLARISCETLATVSLGEGEATVQGVPFAHLSFYNAMQANNIYNQMKHRFIVAYHIQGIDDNSAPTALSSNSNISTGQWYQVPLYDIKPFDKTADDIYRNENEYVRGQGKVKVTTNRLMDERANLPGQQYQVLATNKAVVNQINSNQSRVVITWEVRQCPDVEINGASITNGGCTNGKIATFDGDGNITGWKGHSLPGVVVSTATCVYSNGEDAIGHQPGVETCEEGAKSFSPDPKKPGECQKVRECKEGVWTDWVNNPDDSDCDKPDAPSSVEHFKDRVSRIPGHNWDHCLLTVDNRLLLPKDRETLEYVAAAKAKFDAEHKAENKTLEYNENELTVANLVDAIHMDPQNGTVPANTVCLLAKTIGAAARDPQVSDFDNLFGAFLAFIGYDAASFPSQKTTDCDGHIITDRRFPCKLYSSQYYWGGYVNQTERLKYEQQVSAADSPWRGFPLRGLMRNPLPQVRTGYMSLTDKENRKRFHKEYADLMDRNPCNYPAGQKLNRADVLEYISRLCEYGEHIKPKATRKYNCDRMYSDGNFHSKRVDCYPNCP
ncbi:MAG: hypothetical protein IKP06_03140 [Elusimicrobiaceae bacterium]|nr:hypothetical protein [Elusimicrobiaceae bacterium]